MSSLLCVLFPLCGIEIVEYETICRMANASIYEVYATINLPDRALVGIYLLHKHVM
jgi:hypothetical protein